MTDTLTDEQTASWTSRAGLGTGRIPITAYTSPEYYEREIERVWKRTWLKVGRTTQLAKPGDYFVKALPFANTSILVTRTREGEIKAFHNVCSHRCNKLAWNDSGNARRLQCGFHGWTYGLDGTLVSVPDEENFFEFDKAELGLTPVAVDTWESFVFINLASEPPEPLHSYLGDLSDSLHGYPFEEMSREYRYSGVFNCNWKVARDAFYETYHVPVLHRYSFAGSFVSAKENPYCHNHYYSASKYHGKYSLYANPDYEPTPMEMLAFTVGGGMDSLMVKTDEERSFPPGLNPSRTADWSGDNNSIFPSSMITIFAGFFLWTEFWPLGVDKCVVELQQAMRPPKNASERWTHEVAASTLHFGLLEDISTLEHSQEVLASGAKSHMVLQDHEVLVRLAHHWNQEIAGPYPEGDRA